MLRTPAFVSSFVMRRFASAIGCWSHLVLTLLALTFALGAAPATPGLSPEQIKQQRKEAAARPRPVIVNNDGNDATTRINAPPITHEQFIARRTIGLPGQVSALFYCTGIFNYYSHHSDVSQPLIYETDDGQHDQGWEMGNRGPDTLNTIVDFGHKHDFEVFWSMRMNDAHDSWMPFILSPWKKEHRDWLLDGDRDEKMLAGGWRWSAVNYEVPEVREQVVNILTDVATRYDVDGLDLDFFRHPVFFRPQLFGQPVGQDQRDLLTKLMRDVRKMADRRAGERGRPMLIAVRVPDSAEFCSAIGIDLERWLKEDLVDLLMVGGYFQLNPWETSVELGHRYGVPVFPSLDDPRFSDLEAQDLRKSDAGFRGRASEAWSAGADGVYMFNYLNFHRSRDPLLKQLGDPTTMATKKRRYFAGTISNSVARKWLLDSQKYATMPNAMPDETPALKPGKPVTAELRAAPVEKNSTVVARLRFEETLANEPVTIKLNGNPIPPGTIDGNWMTFPVEPEQVQKGLNRFEATLSADAKADLHLEDLMLEVVPKS